MILVAAIFFVDVAIGKNIFFLKIIFFLLFCCVEIDSNKNFIMVEIVNIFI